MEFNFVDQIKQKSDEELTDNYINARDYNPEFVKLVEEEIKIRNINIDTSRQIKDNKEVVTKQKLQEGKDGSPLYILICFILAITGGFLGIYAGYIYSESKITDIDGEKFYVYNEQTRKKGKIMMWIGIGIVLLFLFKFCFRL
jgi:hypothetical protein